LLHLKIESTSMEHMSQRILFVDDEVPIRETLSLYFRRNGLAVTTAGNRAEAVQMFETTPFGVVILDINLGGENGMELLDLFKSQRPQIPIIMFTGLIDEPDLLREAMTRGASAFMSKMEPLDKLLNEVRRALQPPANVANG
jgi:DNA-binding NtrC family response regulator